MRVADHTISLGVYFSDPDGNGLEVYYELPRSEWRRDRPFSGSDQAEKGRFPGPWDEELRAAQPAWPPPRAADPEPSSRRSVALSRYPAHSGAGTPAPARRECTVRPP